MLIRLCEKNMSENYCECMFLEKVQTVLKRLTKPYFLNNIDF